LRVAFLVPPADYKTEWRWAFEPQADAVRAAGIEVDAVPWTSDCSYGGCDLVLPLVAWGYHKRFGDWLALLERFERERVAVANPVPVLRWNSDKAYLAELAANGIATVPSLAFASFSEQALASAREQFGRADLVVKPTVSASAYGTFRVGIADPFPEQVRGWRMLVQPWLTDIVHSGEWSLLFFDGAFSHCVSKVPKAGEFRVQPEYGGIIGPSDPPPGAVALAEAAIAAAPAPTTYARVDIVVGNDGALNVMELELIEPALFLADAPGAASRFAAAVLSAAESARE
jgi:glutathione synthase/RimK-type ligase-like ATP-grasp enzyme